MNEYSVKKATTAENEEICKLFAIPMAGMISLSKERAPDFFSGAKIQNNTVESYICRNLGNGDLCGVCSIGRRMVYVDGKRTEMQYMSDLRIDPIYQGSGVGRFMLGEIFGKGKLDAVAQTAVLGDNKKMIRVVEKINAFAEENDLSTYNYIGGIITCLLPLPRRQRLPILPEKLVIRWATDKDIPQMQAFFNQEAPKRQFYPHYDFSKLKKEAYYTSLSISDYLLAFDDEVLIGMTGIWNQDEIWRTKVVAYANPLKLLRPFVNFFSRLRAGVILPSAGSKLRNLYLHTILLKDDDYQLLEKILHHFLNVISRDQYDQLVLGLSEYDPCAKALEKFKNRYILDANYYLVTKDKELVKKYKGKNFYMELARI